MDEVSQGVSFILKRFRYIQQYKGCAPTAGFRRRVSEGKNQWMPLQNVLHDVTLDACAAAVNDSNFLESRMATLLQIFLHNARDVLWMKRMEIDKVFKRKNNGLSKRRFCIRSTSF